MGGTTTIAASATMFPGQSAYQRTGVFAAASRFAAAADIA